MNTESQTSGNDYRATKLPQYILEALSRGMSPVDACQVRQRGRTVTAATTAAEEVERAAETSVEEAERTAKTSVKEIERTAKAPVEEVEQAAEASMEEVERAAGAATTITAASSIADSEIDEAETALACEPNVRRMILVNSRLGKDPHSLITGRIVGVRKEGEARKTKWYYLCEMDDMAISTQDLAAAKDFSGLWTQFAETYRYHRGVTHLLFQHGWLWCGDVPVIWREEFWVKMSESLRSTFESEDNFMWDSRSDPANDGLQHGSTVVAGHLRVLR